MAIGRAIGSAVSGRSPKQIARDAAVGYVGGNVLYGAGVTGAGGFKQNPFANIGTPTVDPNSTGIGQVFQSIGAAPFQPSGTPIFSEDLSRASKIGAGLVGLTALGGFDGKVEEPAGPDRLPAQAREYLTSDLTPAQLPLQYGGQDILTPSGQSVADAYGLDRVLADLVGGQDYESAMFPSFATVGYKGGGESSSKDLKEIPKENKGLVALAKSNPELVEERFGYKARLANGGDIPEMDLRFTGGDIYDPNGAGNVDTVDAKLADGEFVMTKQSVAGIGGGDHNKGIARLYDIMNLAENQAMEMGIGRA